MQLPLFGTPQPQQPHRPKSPGPPPGGQWTKYRSGGRRVLCADCIALIREQGAAHAPLPATARWYCRYVDGPDIKVAYYCDAHKRLRRGEK